MTYIDYRHRVEFGVGEYAAIDAYCRDRGIQWFASCCLKQFDPPCYKAASAALTDHALLHAMKQTGRPLMISTGMSTMEEIVAAVDAIGRDSLRVAHSTSSYPCPVDAINLRMIHTLRARYPDRPIGYSVALAEHGYYHQPSSFSSSSQPSGLNSCSSAARSRCEANGSVVAASA